MSSQDGRNSKSKAATSQTPKSTNGLHQAEEWVMDIHSIVHKGLPIGGGKYEFQPSGSRRIRQLSAPSKAEKALSQNTLPTPPEFLTAGDTLLGSLPLQDDSAGVEGESKSPEEGRAAQIFFRGPCHNQVEYDIEMRKPAPSGNSTIRIVVAVDKDVGEEQEVSLTWYR
jgi:hypothetical protein